MTKIFSWFFVVVFLLAFAFFGLLFYGKYTLEKSLVSTKVKFSKFKFYHCERYFFAQKTSIQEQDFFLVFFYEYQVARYSLTDVAWSPIHGVVFIVPQYENSFLKQSSVRKLFYQDLRYKDALIEVEEIDKIQSEKW